MAGMTCTQCFRQTDIEPPTTREFPAKLIVEMCEKFLCDSCLDELEREILEQSS